jgi:hypothetical protein
VEYDSAVLEMVEAPEISTTETIWPRPSGSAETVKDSRFVPSAIWTVVDSTAWPAMTSLATFPLERVATRAGLPASYAFIGPTAPMVHAGRPITIGYHCSPSVSPLGQVSDDTRWVSWWVEPVADHPEPSTLNATG